MSSAPRNDKVVFLSFRMWRKIFNISPDTEPFTVQHTDAAICDVINLRLIFLNLQFVAKVIFL